MALEARITKTTKEGKEIDAFVAEFTNGTMEQLKELASFLQQEGFTLSDNEADRMREVVRMGIALLETTKKDKSKNGAVSK